MLFKIACLLLLVWLLGAVGIYDFGKPVHAFLLVGLMLLLLAVLRARDDSLRRVASGPAGKR